ncbi:MAG: MFS transporter [Alphaproteobacteria bacterium]|nr:MFS transporter [Alphaproteobacteria bacterium]
MRFLNFGHFLDHYVLLIFPTAVLAIERDWQMSYSQALSLSTPMFLTFALATLPAGWLGDRWPRVHMMSLFYVGCGGCCLAAALAPGPVALSAAMAGLGLFAAIYHPVGIAMVTEAATRRGQALAVNGVWGNMGLAVAAISTDFLAERFGWRMSFLAPGVMALFLGGLHILLAKSGSRAHANSEHPQPAEAPSDPDHRVMMRVLTFVAAAALFGGVIFNAVSLSLPKLLSERLASHTNSLSEIGSYAALIFAVAGLAQLPVGWFLDRYSVRPLLFVLFISQALLLYVTAWVTGYAILPVAMVLVLSMFAWIPVSSWLVGSYVPANWRSRVFSIEYTLSLGTTALVVPALSWMHGTGYGFQDQFTLLAVFAAIVLLAAVVLPRRRPSLNVPSAA